MGPYSIAKDWRLHTQCRLISLCRRTGSVTPSHETHLGLIGKTWGCTTLSNSAWIDPSNSNWAYMYHGCLQAGLVPHVWHHSFLSGCRGHLGPPHPSPGNEAVWVLLLCTTSSLKHKCGFLAFPFTLFLIWNSRNHSGIIKFFNFHF